MRTPTKIFVIMVIPIMAIGNCNAQELQTLLSGYFAEVRSGKNLRTPLEIFVPGNIQTAFGLMHDYLNDSASAVRDKACEIVHSVASHAAKVSIRKEGVQILVSAYSRNDAESKSKILSYLQRYFREDFTPSVQDSIRKLVRKEHLYFDRILKLAGFLGLADLIPEIRPWTQPGNPTQIRWAAYLSLARMGDPSATTEILDRVKKFPVNDDVVYQLFPDLIYTRQPAPIACMVDALQKNEKNCLSADAEREIAIPCGYRIMEMLAPVIEGFPLELDESGDLKTHDYEAALKEIRLWFQSNVDYRIYDSTY